MESPSKKVETLLFLVNSKGTDPKNTNDPLRTDKEQKELEETKERYSKNESIGEKFNFIFRTFSTKHDILKNVQRYSPNIFYFAGHGKPNGSVALEGGDLKFTSLKPLLSEKKDSLKLVVLNACHSSVIAAQLVSEMENIISIGMQGEISDEGAILFAKTLFALLLNGSSVFVACYVAQVLLKKERDFPEIKGNPQFLFTPFIQLVDKNVQIKSVNTGCIGYLAGDVGDEWNEIKNAYNDMDKKKMDFAIDVELKCSMFNIATSLATKQPTIAYFRFPRVQKADGAKIELHTDKGDADYWSEEEMMHLFTAMKLKLSHPKLFVFNSPYSSNFAESFVTGMDFNSEFAVIYWNELDDKDSRAFIKTFFMLIFEGMSLNTAFELASDDLKTVPVLEYCPKATKAFGDKPFLKYCIPEPVSPAPITAPIPVSPTPTPVTTAPAPAPVYISLPVPVPVTLPIEKPAESGPVVNPTIHSVLWQIISIPGLCQLIGSQRDVLLIVMPTLVNFSEEVKYLNPPDSSRGARILHILATNCDERGNLLRVQNLYDALSHLKNIAPQRSKLKEMFL